MRRHGSATSRDGRLSGRPPEGMAARTQHTTRRGMSKQGTDGRGGKGQGKSYFRQVARNRRAFHEYHIHDRLEAGLVLHRHGGQGGALRQGATARRLRGVQNGEAFPGRGPHQPLQPRQPREPPARRARASCCSEREIERLAGRTQAKGFTVVPLSMYIKGRRSRWNSPWSRARSSTTSADRARTRARPRSAGGDEVRGQVAGLTIEVLASKACVRSL